MSSPAAAVSVRLEQVMARLQAMADPRNVEGMARFGMTAERRLGISVVELRRLARGLGRDHALALALWQTGVPEARILASLVGEPERLTGRQMEAWVSGFDSWDVCDQVCQNLFDRTPLAWEKVNAWAERDGEYVRRAAFALMASLARHDRHSDDGRFLALLPLIEQAADDERNFVRKAVSWALRGIGKRSPRLGRAARRTARELARRDSRAARWIGRDALRDLA